MLHRHPWLDSTGGRAKGVTASATIYLSVYLPVCQPACLPACLSVYLAFALDAEPTMPARNCPPAMGYDGLAGWGEEPRRDRMHTQVLEPRRWTSQEWSWQIC